MITIKNRPELEKMAVAGDVVVEVHAALREAAEPGVTLKELDDLAAEIIRRRGCIPSFLGYHGFPANVCISLNDMIVHGIPDGRRIKQGDVISVDAGAVYLGWHGDAAITFPVGAVPAETKRLIRVAEEALWAGIDQARPGNRLGDIGHAIQTVAESAGFSVVREYIGHGIGRQMHEDPQVPNYGRPGQGLRLKPGMAICIEPMLNSGGSETRLLDDGWSVVTADGSLSAHFEHTVAITKAGPRVLTQ